MLLTWTPYSLIPAFAAVMSLGLSAYAWRQRAAPGALPFGIAALFIAEWAVGYFFELNSGNLTTAVFWDDFQFLGTAGVVPAFLIFALQYTNRPLGYDRRLWAALAVEPILTTLAAYTNAWHSLIRSQPVFTPSGPFPVLSYAYGPWLWAIAIYYYGVVVAGLALLIRQFFRASHSYRAQIGLVILGMGVPWVGSFLTVLGLVPLPAAHLDISPLTFSIGSVLWAWGVFRYHLFDIVPLARELLMDGMPDAVLVLDAQNRIADLNLRAQRLLGRAASEAIGQPAQQVLAAWPNLVERYLHVLETQDEFFVQAADRRLCYHLRLSPLRHPRGQFIGRLAVVQDITARKQMETELRAAYDDLERRVQHRTAELERVNRELQAEIAERQRAEATLRANEALLRALINNIPFDLWACDARGRYILQNALSFDLVGDLHGKTVDDLDVPPERRVIYKEKHQRALRGETVREEIEETIRGENRFLLSVQTPIWDSDRILGFVGMNIDLTERKRVEVEREALIRELEQKNAELERFTYTVSHDLKSPLITIRGFLGYLEQDARSGNTARLQADVTRITDATDKMQRLLDELLELSRIGRKMNPPQALPFGEIVREALALVEGRLAARGVRVAVAEGLPVVRGDRARLVEVVQNLVDNAAKFMGEQPAPRIEIGMREAGGQPVFCVADNGIGIDPAYHEKVFGLFDKLDPKSEGTGIGLALVKRILEVHGGRIWVESEGLGKGAAFCFTLPLSASKEESA
jgi:PAS domain S-box-containing protein